MFEAAEAVMRPEMVMGEWRLGSGGLEAVMVMLVGQPAPWLRRQVAPSTDERLNAVAQSSPQVGSSPVNRPFLYVLRAWDRDLPPQTHPQNPIHSSLARFETM